MKRQLLIAWAVTVIHAIVGVLVLVDSRAINITRLHEMADIGHPNFAGLLMLTSASCAVYGMTAATRPFRWLVPQQFLLMLAAVASVDAIVESVFGDGVTRPRAFIAADQLPMIVIAVMHLFVLSSAYMHSWASKAVKP